MLGLVGNGFMDVVALNRNHDGQIVKKNFLDKEKYQYHWERTWVIDCNVQVWITTKAPK
jgi:hypothetical protein